MRNGGFARRLFAMTGRNPRQRQRNVYTTSTEKAFRHSIRGLAHVESDMGISWPKSGDRFQIKRKSQRDREGRYYIWLSAFLPRSPGILGFTEPRRCPIQRVRRGQRLGHTPVTRNDSSRILLSRNESRKKKGRSLPWARWLKAKKNCSPWGTLGDVAERKKERALGYAHGTQLSIPLSTEGGFRTEIRAGKDKKPEDKACIARNTCSSWRSRIRDLDERHGCLSTGLPRSLPETLARLPLPGIYSNCVYSVYSQLSRLP